jgi:hypothetical protein
MNLNMRTVLMLFFFISMQHAYAQNEFTKIDSLGSVVIKKDSRIDILATKQAEVNKLTRRMSSSGNIRGYRIQVISTQNRDQANSIKAEMLRRFPDQGAYMLYQSPNFRVRVGNFLTQKDAQDMRKDIAALYPGRGIYIVPDLIEYVPAEDEDLSDF